MKNKRREFLKRTALTGLGVAGSSIIKGFASEFNNYIFSNSNTSPAVSNTNFNEENLSIIGLYGPWAAGLTEKKIACIFFQKERMAKPRNMA